MMSDRQLGRFSIAYRRGYRAGYAGREKFCAVKPEYIEPFADFDYEQGYAAGANDKRLERRHYHGKAQEVR